jgi:hypothetical protein
VKSFECQHKFAFNKKDKDDGKVGEKLRVKNPRNLSSSRALKLLF